MHIVTVSPSTRLPPQNQPCNQQLAKCFLLVYSASFSPSTRYPPRVALRQALRLQEGAHAVIQRHGLRAGRRAPAVLRQRGVLLRGVQGLRVVGRGGVGGHARFAETDQELPASGTVAVAARYSTLTAGCVSKGADVTERDLDLVVLERK